MTLPTLRYRSKGVAVYRLQTALIRALHSDSRDFLGRPYPQNKVLETDSQYGEITLQAVTAYQTVKQQSDPRMEVDGICGNQTWSALRADLGGRLPQVLPPQIVSGGRRQGSSATLAPKIEPPAGTPMPSWMAVAWAEYARNVHEYRGVAANPRILEYFRVGWVSKDSIATAVGEGRRNATRILNAAKRHDARVAKRRAKKGKDPVAENQTWAHKFANARQRDLDEIPWCAAFVGWCLREAGYPRPNWSNRLGAKSWRPQNHVANPGTCRYGAVAVIDRGGSFHVGFAIDQGPGWVRFLGGNQADAVNGSGGAVNVRKYVQHKNYDRVTFLWPDAVWPDVNRLSA